MTKSRDESLAKLVDIQYERNDINFIRNKFRVHGDVVDIFPVYSNDTAIRVEFFGDEIDRICEINALTGQVKNTVSMLRYIRLRTMLLHPKSLSAPLMKS